MLKAHFFGATIVAIVLGLSLHSSDKDKPSVEATPCFDKRIDESIARGAKFLIRHQSMDGAWRSGVYGTFRDGTALTPMVLFSLSADVKVATALAQADASGWIDRQIKDGEILEGEGLPYPIYTAAFASIYFSRPERTLDRKNRDIWLKYLLDRQLTEKNGWHPDDPDYGGWGYYPAIPKKPEPGEIIPAAQLLESNLSATAFVLEAMHLAGYKDPAAWQAAAKFVLRCQNRDGGFHFVKNDPLRNKAGLLPNGKDGFRYNSYGSTTADGLSCLWYLSQNLPGFRTPTLEPDPKDRAQNWLVQNFSPARHPGKFLPSLEPNRNAVFYYYTASVSRTFQRANVKTIRGRAWDRDLARTLMSRQQEDGSWYNPIELVRENDQIVATCFAIMALDACRSKQDQVLLWD